MSKHERMVCPNAAAEDHRPFPWHVRRLTVPVPFSQVLDIDAALRRSEQVLGQVMADIGDNSVQRLSARRQLEAGVLRVSRGGADAKQVTVVFDWASLRSWHDAVVAAYLPFYDDRVAMHDFGDVVSDD